MRRGPPVEEAPELRDVPRLARRSARFYRALGAPFDLASFSAWDPEGRDRWGASSANLQLAYLRRFTQLAGLRVVIDLIPLGHPNNRPSDGDAWLLGPNAAKHFAALRDAGVIGLLFAVGDSPQRMRELAAKRAAWALAL